MANIISMNQVKIARMTHVQILSEAVRCGRFMESIAGKARMTAEQKDWCTRIFNEAIIRSQDDMMIYNCKAALSVLKFF